MNTTPPNTPPRKTQPPAFVTASATQSGSPLSSDGIVIGRKEYPLSDDELPSDDEQKQIPPPQPLKKIYTFLLLTAVALPVLMDRITPNTSWWRNSIKQQQMKASIDFHTNTALDIFNLRSSTTTSEDCPYHRDHYWEAIVVGETEKVEFFQKVLSFVGNPPAKPHPNTLVKVFKRCAQLIEEDLADNCHVYHPTHE